MFSWRGPGWRRLAHGAFAAFVAILAILLLHAARAIDWAGVAAALRSYEIATLIAASALTISSYLVYCGYDLGARRYAHHRLSTRRTMLIAFVSYAFSLNVGALVGGTGMRLRLYSRSGLALGAISRVIAFAISTNWLGYLVLGGLLFASNGVAMPPRWASVAPGLQALGVAMLGAVAAYLVACRFAHGRVLHLRGHHFRFPALPLAFTQLGLAAINWSIMGAILYVLLPAQIGYGAALGALLFAAVATALTHIPAGIGVLEAVYVALLSHVAPASQILAAVLAYRAFYYLAPLLVAVTLYLLFEAGGKPSDPQAAGAPW